MEELKQSFREIKQKMDAKTLSLQTNIQELQSQIGTSFATTCFNPLLRWTSFYVFILTTDIEESKTEQLKKRISSNTGHAQLMQEKVLKQLNDKVS